VKPGPVRLRRNDALRRRADDIIAALRAERIRRGLAQRTLGLSFGAAEASVGNWENRIHATPPAVMVRAWHEALGMRVPADVEIVFRPDIPRCPSRPAYERHRKRREACATCREWFNRHRRVLAAEKRRAGSVQ
jgi:transcriptional regulator with XRE-family HTH domain